MNNSEICVPASAVNQHDEEGGEVGPEVGDSVEVTVAGKVSRVEGGNVYFTPDTANGEPISKPSGDRDAMHEDDEASMDKLMAASGEGMGY